MIVGNQWTEPVTHVYSPKAKFYQSCQTFKQLNRYLQRSCIIVWIQEKYVNKHMASDLLLLRNLF